MLLPPVAVSPTGRHVALLSGRHRLLIMTILGGRVVQDIDLVDLLPNEDLLAWAWRGCLWFDSRGDALHLQAADSTILRFGFEGPANFSRLPKDVRGQAAAHVLPMLLAQEAWADPARGRRQDFQQQPSAVLYF